jgi:hypothetical protein
MATPAPSWSGGGKMWVVFWTSHEKQDVYIIYETKKEAKAQFKKLVDQDKVYCAGYAPIKKSTDWTPTI